MYLIVLAKSRTLYGCMRSHLKIKCRDSKTEGLEVLTFIIGDTNVLN